jgi:hypothetical protein
MADDPAPPPARPANAGQFRKGQSGNPAGRAVGTVTKVTALVQKLLADKAEAIVTRIVADALAGNGLAQRLVLERLMPPPRAARYITLDLPPVVSVADLPLALAAVASALATGSLSVEDAEVVAGIFKNFAEAIHSTEVESRLRVIEGELAAQKDRSHGLRAAA